MTSAVKLQIRVSKLAKWQWTIGVFFPPSLDLFPLSAFKHFSTVKAQYYNTRRKLGIWWSCVDKADSLDIDILRNGSLSASITRHAFDFILAQRWTTLHILGDMKPWPWICIWICRIGISHTHTHTSPLTFGGPILHCTSSLLSPPPPSQNIYLPTLCSTVQIWWMKAFPYGRFCSRTLLQQNVVSQTDMTKWIYIIDR